MSPRDGQGYNGYGNNGHGPNGHGHNPQGRDPYGHDGLGRDSHGRESHGHDAHPREGHGERWFDAEAGPVVRPYAVTKGRTQATGTFGLIDVVAATDGWPSDHFRPGPEHRRILSLCRRPVPVVDLTSEINLPVGVVRILLSDLAAEGMLRIVSAQRQPVADQRLLRMVLDGLESL
jgi:Protein of unknown function (DUF742)